MIFDKEKEESIRKEVVDVIRRFYLTNEIKSYDQAADEIIEMVLKAQKEIHICQNCNQESELVSTGEICSKCYC